MKHLFLLFFIAPILIFAQPKIADIIWVGENNEYLQISKRKAILNKGQHFQEFHVVKYVKNSYFTLASQHISGYLEQKYDIMRFTRDTLIITPVDRDIFRLSQPNKANQYVFVNSLNGFTFVKLHFRTSIVVPECDYNLSITLTIDSAKKSFVKLHDDYMNETNVVTTSISQYEFKALITILAGLNIGDLLEYYVPADPSVLAISNVIRLNDYLVFTDHAAVECCNSSLEIRYNDQVKTCTGCRFVPFYHPYLEHFLVDYIANKSSQSGRRPSLW